VSGAPVPTDSRAACTSRWGVSDMVGNVWERVGGRWGVGHEGSCTSWPGAFGGDDDCLGVTPTGNLFLNALFRGGGWDRGAGAGSFAVQSAPPSSAYGGFGFRCAR
jgi:formylglycine-generating enzyme required for sulfatase activity